MTLEASVQSEIRLHASQQGACLWRNNVGVLPDKRGVPIRFGLANDSAKMNKVLKSPDLVGFVPIRIMQHHVGRILPVFAGIECKRTGWAWTGNPHEAAQSMFLSLVTLNGGIGCFATSVDDYEQAVRSVK